MSVKVIDTRLLNFIRRRFHCKFFDFIMPKISALGNGGTIWIAAAFCLMTKETTAKYGYCILLALVMGVVIGNVILKHLFARPRPCWINQNIDLLVREPSDYSFPSGHTLSSTAAAVILLNALPAVGIAALILAVLILFSRMYLYVHYPSDILGGIMLGIFVGGMSLFIIK